MASKKKAPAETKAAAQSSPKKPAARRDVRPFIYAGLDVLLGVLLILIITKAAPNRHTWAQAIMWGLPSGVILMGIGTMLGAFYKQRLGWIIAVAAGAFLMAISILVMALLLSSAAFLTGVYGAFGRAAATGMLVACALILELIGVIPVLQMKYLMTRAGRRAFGLQPLWAKA